MDQLQVNRTTETNKWDDIKIDIEEVLRAQLKSIDSNIRMYEEYKRKFQQQSNAIEAGYQEIRELVSKTKKCICTFSQIKLNLLQKKKPEKT